MRIPFRQGIVRYQTDNAGQNPNPTFLQPSNGGASIDLLVAPDPTIITFAHGDDTDYLFEERLSIPRAWSGFVSNVDYWLYWDIDQLTGERTFGHTRVEPVYGSTIPSNLQEDLHWFDTKNELMKVYSNGVFAEKIRVFAGRYRGGAVVDANELGSQVGINKSIKAGFILFDDLGNPVRKVRRKRATKFITTESNFSTHASNATTVRLEAQVETARANDNIAAYQCVSYEGPNRIGFASRQNIDRDIVGIVREDMYVGEVGTFITSGFVRNPLWNWQESTTTQLYCDDTGQLTTDIPETGSFQQVATIVSPTTILVDIRQRIILGDYSPPAGDPPAPAPTCPSEEPISLTDGIVETIQQLPSGCRLVYTIPITTTDTVFTISSSSSTQDAYVYAALDFLPSNSEYDYLRTEDDIVGSIDDVFGSEYELDGSALLYVVVEALENLENETVVVNLQQPEAPACPSEEPIELQRGVGYNDVTMPAGCKMCFFIDVPDDRDFVSVALSTWNPEVADVFVSINAEPDIENEIYDYRAGYEGIYVYEPPSGRWNICVVAYEELFQQQIIANFSPRICPVFPIEELFDEQTVTVPEIEETCTITYYIDIPENVATATFSLTKPSLFSGDVFISRESIPTEDSNDYRGFGRDVTIAEPVAGRWYITVGAFDTLSNSTLTASYRLNSET